MHFRVLATQEASEAFVKPAPRSPSKAMSQWAAELLYQRRVRILLACVMILGALMPFVVQLLPARREHDSSAQWRSRKHPWPPFVGWTGEEAPRPGAPTSYALGVRSLVWSGLRRGRSIVTSVKLDSEANFSEAEMASAGFSWRGYLLRNPDLRAQGIRTPSAAYKHYLEKGQAIGRRHDRLPVLLRYSVCHGIFNQMYAHLAAFMLAEKLDADIVLPPSLYRSSFEAHVSDVKGHDELTWHTAPAGHLLDVDFIKGFFADRGRSVRQWPAHAQPPDCSQPQSAFPTYSQPGFLDVQVVMLKDTYMAGMNLDDLWDKAADAVNAQHRTLVNSGYPADSVIVLDLPSTFFSIDTSTALAAAQEAARAIRFNHTVARMAANVQMSLGVPKKQYNGLHLRLENDVSDWLTHFGGADQYLEAYSSAMKQAGFIANTRQQALRRQPLGRAAGRDYGSSSSSSSSVADQGEGVDSGGAGGGQREASGQLDLYVASGVLGYADQEERDVLLAYLKPYGAKLHYKEMYLAKEELDQFNPEQQALLDFLVLADARTFVGLETSTFSTYLREHRKAAGFTSKHATVLVRSEPAGADSMFQRCTVIHGDKGSSRKS